MIPPPNAEIQPGCCVAWWLFFEQVGFSVDTFKARSAVNRQGLVSQIKL